MLVTVNGIVIGKRDIGENNYFLDVLTDKFGVIEVIAHGIKKVNSKNAPSMGLFSYSKFCFNKTNLRYSVNSAEPICSFFGLSADLKKFSLAVYFADIIKYTAAAEQSGEDILRFLAITFYKLEKENADCEIIKGVFEFRISSMLGFTPDLRACRECGSYLNGDMFFSPEKNNLICEKCCSESETNEEIKLLLPDLLHTMRFVLYSPLEKVYAFTLKGTTREEFSVFAENYLLSQLGRNFKTLEYYKNIG